MNNPVHLIDGTWQTGAGAAFDSRDPADGSVLWQGNEADAAQVDAAVGAARRAFDDWARRPFEDRDRIVRAFVEILEREKPMMAERIARETGKPLWDATGEAGAMIKKADISRQAYHERTGTHDQTAGGVRTRLEHRPHGVMAVFGPYNFPGHLPNGHILPALLAGNTIVFKPSEQTPAVAQAMVKCWQEAGLPDGVLNLVQGARVPGQALSAHAGIDGILFTGSAATGKAIHAQLGGRPEVILALEMGGNNPQIAWDIEDEEEAALLVAQSAFISSGQRCTCARRLIVPEGPQGDALLAAVAALIPTIRVGPWNAEPEPFMGPLIAPAAAGHVMDRVDALIQAGARPIVAPERPEAHGATVTPGLIDVSGVADLPDEEIFGPVLQVQRAGDFDTAISLANRTRYGLSAGLLSDSADRWAAFYARIRAGIVNWNKPLPGAASTAPFGGIGISGNHRPSAYYAADYCAYPVATMAEAGGKIVDVPRPKGIGS